MRFPMTCSLPTCNNQCGWEITHPGGDYGQDPPDYEPYNEDFCDENGYAYCSQECLDEAEEEK